MGASQALRTVALAVGLMSLVSLFAAPAASLLSFVHGAFVLPTALARSGLATVLPVAQMTASLAALYLFSRALLLAEPASVVLGSVLTVLALLLVYAGSMALVLRRGVNAPRCLLLLAIAALALYTLAEATSAPRQPPGGPAYVGIELVAYGGLLYIGSALPYSAIVVLSLVFLTCDLLRPPAPEEPPQALEELGQAREDGVVGGAE